MRDHQLNNDRVDIDHFKVNGAIGIYCTVSSDELQLALKTLSIAASSQFVTDIVILITDRDSINEKYNTEDIVGAFYHKFEITCGNYGYGYDISISEGGYDQISARNDALRLIYNKNVDWVMQHDADDLYDPCFYEKICVECSEKQAVMAECYTLNSCSSYLVNSKAVKKIYGRTLLSPHIRVWKKELALQFKKSKLASNTHVNETRHCGVEFPDGTKIILIKKPSHYHLHRILNKRHSNSLDNGEVHEINLGHDMSEKLKAILPSIK